ncbi:MAG: radical SAM protein [Calditrichaeota bacterium]|nr:MAG: radical SAM protein [Calditrichota bacterium]
MEKLNDKKTLRITEIFFSIQGESTRAGLPCIFIRTTGCDLRCRWCDTAYAFSGGTKMTVELIMAEIRQWPCKLVELTGGEPVLQKYLPDLISALFAENYQVMIETGGHLDLSSIDERVKIIVDVKCPGSGESEKMCFSNLENILPDDEVKFVIQDRDDYDYAAKIIKKYKLESRTTVLLSPVFGGIEYKKVVNWLLKDGIQARIQLQLHKYIWDPQQKGV